jgi:nitrate reductase gamma subunit
MSDRALFAIAPYVAALIFLFGTVVRLSRERPQRRAASSPPVRALFRGHRVGAIALIVVLAIHIATWLVPGLPARGQSVTRVIAIEIALFAIGLVAAVGLARVTVTSLRELPASVRVSAFAPPLAPASAPAPAPARPRLADMMLLGVLAVAVASGLAMAARYRWASTWSAVTLTPYVRSLVELEPNVQLLALPYLIKLHVFSGVALLAVLPFTSVMHRLLIPIHRLLDRLVTPVAAAMARQSKRAGEWASESGRALMWPEEED